MYARYVDFLGKACLHLALNMKGINNVHSIDSAVSAQVEYSTLSTLAWSYLLNSLLTESSMELAILITIRYST